MNDGEIDSIKIRLYREFRENNGLLRRRSLLDYYAQQGEYVDRRLQEELNKLRAEDDKRETL